MHDTFQCTLKRHRSFWFIALTIAFALSSAVSAAGQKRTLGTPAAAAHPTVTKAAISDNPIDAFKTYTNASYRTGGVALRNRGGGVLHVGGVTGWVQEAYLYWAILFNTPQPDKWLYHAQMGRISPNPTILGIDLEGTLLGIGADPCWGSNGIAVFRARVPKSMAIGNGDYWVTIPSGRIDGSDPWININNLVYPLAEGASMVIVGTGTYTVGIYDAGFTATTFGQYGAGPDSNLTYTLNLPGTVTTDALWDNIGADGQTGGYAQIGSYSFEGARVDDPGTSLETTTINTVQISGAGGLDNDSDWNGSSGFPVPELWDDTGHDIFSAVNGDTTAVISFIPLADCLTTVFNVLAVE